MFMLKLNKSTLGNNHILLVLILKRSKFQRTELIRYHLLQ